MAKTNLASMSVDALLKLRDEIGDMLSRRAEDLKRQLSRLAGSSPSKRQGRRGPARGHKVAPKYRNAQGDTWSGRGLRPRWLTAAIKDGKKVDDFLIGGRAAGGRRKKRR